MVVNCLEFEFVCNTSIGNQTILSNAGFTITGYIIVSFQRTTDATFQDHYSVAIGFSDGTNSGHNGGLSEDAQTSSDTGRHHSNDVMRFMSFTSPGSSVDGIAQHSSFGTGDDIVINWTDAPSSAWRCFGIAFGGDVSCEVKQFTVGTTGTGNVSYTTTMSNPQFGFFLPTTSATTPNSEASHGNPALGVALSTSKRGLWAGDSESGRTTMDTWSLFDDTKCLGCLVTTTGGIDYVADFVSWNDNGFTLNYSDGATTSSAIFYAMVLKGAAFDIGTIAKRTSTGDTVVNPSGMGIVRAIGMFSNNLAKSTSVVSHNRISIGLASSDTLEAGGWCGDTDAAADSICVGRSDDSNILTMATENATAGSSTTEALANISSVGDGTFTLTYTTATSLVADIIWFAIGEIAAAEVVEDLPIQSYGNIHEYFDSNKNAIFG